METCELTGRARAFLARQAMLRQGDTVIVALSGGADSMALFHFLFLESRRLSLRLLAAHVNHGLRGARADADEAFVRAQCAARGVPLFVRRLSPPASAGEDWARRQRYAFFDGLAAAEKAKVATAHTADDQAETVLLRLARGASARGAAGIPPVRGPYVRPLLEVTRAQVLAYLAAEGVPHVEDETNAGDAYARNRARHQVLPALESLHPGAGAALARFAGDMREVADYLDGQAAALLRRCGGEDGVYDAALLRAAPPAVCKAALRGLLCAEAGGEKAALTGRLYALLEAGGGALDVGACVFRLCQGQLRAEPASVEEQTWELPFAPGVWPLPGGFQLQVRVLEAQNWENLEKDAEKGLNFAGDYARIYEHTHFRTRRPGDRFARAGRGVEKPLRKWYSEEKIPPARRAALPVLARGSTVLWSAAFGFAQEARATARTKTAVVITWAANGGI